MGVVNEMETENAFSELVGKTLTSVTGSRDGERHPVKVGDNDIEFTTDQGEVYALLHEQVCCESVEVADICGDADDLVGSPIVQAEESRSGDGDEWPSGIARPEDLDSYTWTFYRIATAKGLVVIRWLGESNGYYSESVEFVRRRPGGGRRCSE
jgi:hypothetical protein